MNFDDYWIWMNGEYHEGLQMHYCVVQTIDFVHCSYKIMPLMNLVN